MKRYSTPFRALEQQSESTFGLGVLPLGSQRILSLTNKVGLYISNTFISVSLYAGMYALLTRYTIVLASLSVFDVKEYLLAAKEATLAP